MLKLLKKFINWLRKLYSYKAYRITPPRDEKAEVKKQHFYLQKSMGAGKLPSKKSKTNKGVQKTLIGRHK